MLFYNDLPGDVLLPYVRLSDIDVSGYREYGITIGSFNGRSGFSDVRVERVTSHDNGDSGMVTYAAALNVHKNVYVGASRFYNNQGQPDSPTNSGSGLVLGGVDTATVEGNLAFKNGGLNTTIQGGVGIWAYDSTRVTDPAQRVLRQPHRRTRGWWRLRLRPERLELGHPVQLLARQRGQRLHARPRHGHGDPHEQRHPLQRQPERRPEERHRRDPRLRAGQQRRDLPEHHLARAGLDAARSRSGSTASSRRSKVHIRNNIIRTKTGVPLLQVSAAAVGSAVDLRFQGNDWYTSGGTFKFKWGTPTYGSLSAWRTATGAERVGTDAVGTSADPLFVGGDAPTLGNTARLDELRNYYGLSAGSTIVDKGLNLTGFGVTPSPVDFTGNPTPNGAAPDPGAFEALEPAQAGSSRSTTRRNPT